MKATSPPQSSANGSGGPGVVGSVTEFANDLATLAELQAKLAAIDLQECKTRATWPVVVIATGLVMVLAAVPVFLLGVAELLARALNVSTGWTMLGTGLAVLLLAGLLMLLAVRELTKSLEPIRRSREELVRNLAWVRTVLVYSGRSTPRRGL